MAIPKKVTNKIRAQCQDLAKNILEEKTKNTRVINFISDSFLFIFLADKLIEIGPGKEILNIRNNFLLEVSHNIEICKDKCIIKREIDNFISSLRKEKNLLNPTIEEYMKFSKITIGFSLINSILKNFFIPEKDLSVEEIDFISKNMREINDAYEKQVNKNNFFRIKGIKIIDRDKFSRTKLKLVINKIENSDINNSYKVSLKSLVNNIVNGYSREKLQI